MISASGTHSRVVESVAGIHRNADIAFGGGVSERPKTDDGRLEESVSKRVLRMPPLALPVIGQPSNDEELRQIGAAPALQRVLLGVIETVKPQSLSGAVRDLPTLDSHEQALFEDLRNDRLGDRVRLEQERVKYQLVRKVVLALHR
jgi:hypothetical protein